MLLYLRVLEYACDNGYQVFDFGRSSAGEELISLRNNGALHPRRFIGITSFSTVNCRIWKVQGKRDLIEPYVIGKAPAGCHEVIDLALENTSACELPQHIHRNA